MRKNYAVIAAGGLGTRLKDYKHNESTKVLIDIGGLSMISSQVMQLKSWGFRDFIVITNPDFNDLIKNDLQKNFLDENISYVIQPSPKGIADALSYAEAEIDKNSLLTFILGDNFFGENPLEKINLDNFSGAHLFVKEVENPEEFGVMEIDKDGNAIDIYEKPKEYISNLAVVGIYIYDTSCFENIRKLTPSNRGELEITDLNKIYLDQKKVLSKVLSSWWIDAGTPERIEELKKLI